MKAGSEELRGRWEGGVGEGVSGAEGDCIYIFVLFVDDFRRN